LETITIKIVDPKVKGLLSELQHLGLIQIDDQDIIAQKQDLIEKLAGHNLKDLDSKQLKDMLNQ